MTGVIYAFEFNNFFGLLLLIMVEEYFKNSSILQLKISTITSTFEETKYECQSKVLINKSK